MKNQSHREIQEKLINKLILFLAIIAIPASLFSSWRIFDIGLQPLFVIQGVISFSVILIAFFRKSIPYVIKVAFIIITFSILGVAASIDYGLASFLIEYMMLTILIAIVFCGRKWALLIFIANSMIILTIGLLSIKGIITPSGSIDAYALRFSSWIVNLSGFVFITALTVLVVGEIGYLLSYKITELQKKNNELQIALNEIKKLQGIIPICSQCKKIKDSAGYWSQVESYIEQHSEAQFSHGLCEQCVEELYGDQKWFQKSKLKKK